MNKFNESQGHPIMGRMNDEYEFGQDEDMECVVCNRWYPDRHSRQSQVEREDGILKYHTIQLGDTIYIIPNFHVECRELFELNPLAYE